jgi:purine-binding chemotaxis protein CheW
MNEQMNPMIDKVVVFTVDDLMYALPLHNVTRVVYAFEISKLPKAPDIIAGIINLRGQILPVVDLRKRFGLEGREIIPDDNFIIARTKKREIALWINEVKEIKEIEPGRYTDIKASLPYAEFIKGVAKIEDDIILIYDLEQCLNLTEEKMLEEALLNRS